MSDTPKQNDVFAPVDVPLKNPPVAALLAWLWPGAGHIYQGRYGKGVLFMVCILATYFFGLAVGGGHVVYASFRKPDVRYPYLAQVCVGLPALPAIPQNWLVMDDKEPLFGSKLMAPPGQPVYEQEYDELASWYKDHGFYFELGTLYTMIAGLLNVLVIFDAYSGPMFTSPYPNRGDPPTEKEK
jgi:hypothetical protein